MHLFSQIWIKRNESIFAYKDMYVNIHCSFVCCCSVTQSRLTLCNPMVCSTPGLLVHHQLLELAQTHVYWVGDAIQPSHPLSSPSPPAFQLSQHQGLFQWVSSSIMWPKYWSFGFSVSPSNEYSGLISFRIDWFDLLADQGTQEFSPVPQFKSIKASPTLEQ